MRRTYYRIVLTVVLAGFLAGKTVIFPAYGMVGDGDMSELSTGEDGKEDASLSPDGEGSRGEAPENSHGEHGEGGNPPSPDGEDGEGETPSSPDGEDGEGETPSSPDEENGEGETPPSPDGEDGEGETPSSPDGENGEGETPPSPDGEDGEGETPPSPDEENGKGENPPSSDREDIEGENPEHPDSGQTGHNQEELENPGDIRQPEIQLQMIEIPLDEEVQCGTVEELLTLLETGEEICLTGDILVAGSVDLNIAPEDEAVVNMNGYSIVVSDKGNLFVDGPIRFQGAAGDKALFQISGKTTFKNGAGVWAEGDGAVAVEISETKNGKYALQTDNAYIGVSGDNSIALKWTGKGDCSLQYAHIEAEGENSVGIEADTPVELKLCLVEAEGSSVVTDKVLIVDTSQVTPLPEQSEVITREIYLDGRLDENGVSVEAGTDCQGLYDKLAPSASYVFCDPTGERKMWTRDFTLNWKDLPEELSEPGVYRAMVEAEGYPDWFFIEIPEIEIEIYVVDPKTVHIEEIFRMEDMAVLYFLNPVEDAQRIELFCSADGGDTWQDADSMPGCSVQIDPLTITVEGLEFNHTYRFCVAVTGGSMEGLSSVKSFGYYENDSDRFGHGDRDGDDRDDQGDLPPWNSAPPPGDEFGGSGDPDSDGRGTAEADGTSGTSDGDGTLSLEPSAVKCAGIPEPCTADRIGTQRLSTTAAADTQEPSAAAGSDPNGPLAADKIGRQEPSIEDGMAARDASGAGAGDRPGASGSALGEDGRAYGGGEAEDSFHEDGLRTGNLLEENATENREEPAGEGMDADSGRLQRDNPSGFIFRTVLGAAAGIAVLSWYKRRSRRKP